MPFDGAQFTKTAEPQVVADLRALRESLSDPAQWWDGGNVIVGDQNCLVTAGMHVCRDRWKEARAALSRAYGSHCLWHFNDTHTHAEVLDLISRAIASELANAAGA